MGRGKLDMELISKEKSRILTFNKRKAGLMKKLHELSTLCDVSACMIIYGPIQENHAVEPEIWPQNRDEVHRLIDVFRAKRKDSGSKTYGLSDFFQERKRKVEEELAKLRKKNVQEKYPTWDEFMNFLNEAELRTLVDALNIKAQIVKSRIEFMKRKQQELDVMNNMMAKDFAVPPKLTQIYGTSNNDQEIKPRPIIGIDSMNSYHNSLGNSASLERQIFYNQAMATAGDGPRNPIICYNNLPQIFHAPPAQRPVSPYFQWPNFSGVSPPSQMHLTSNKKVNSQGDDAEYDAINYLWQFK